MSIEDVPDLAQARMDDLAADRLWQKMTRSVSELLDELTGKGGPETRVAIRDGNALRTIASIEVTALDGSIEIHLDREPK